MKNIRWLLVLLGIVGLIGVRVFEDKLFYDPFLEYFRVSDSYLPFPSFDWKKLLLSHLFRFFLNLVCSIIIFHFLFLNKIWTLQGFFLIVLFFLVSLFLYFLFLFNISYEVMIFYVRRLVIHPVILLFLVCLYSYRI